MARRTVATGLTDWRGAIVGSPAYAPRMTGPLRLPKSNTELTKSRTVVLADGSVIAWAPFEHELDHSVICLGQRYHERGIQAFFQACKPLLKLPDPALSVRAVRAYRAALRGAHLVLLAVEPRYRKTGVGGAMLKWLERTCITAGIQDIRLEVRAGNQLAQKFYRNRDFTITGRIPGYYDRREAAVVMERKLTQAGS